MDTVFVLIDLDGIVAQNAIVGIYKSYEAASLAEAIEEMKNPDKEYCITEYPLD